jgi:branched-chain amino acid transport system permease protein
MKDSQAACATLGLNLTTTKLAVFALSAGMAGVAGALFGAMRTVAGTLNFNMEQSLPVLLLVVVYGVTTTSGALFGGLSLGAIQIVAGHFPSLANNLTFLTSGLAGITLGAYPDGVVPGVAERLRSLVPAPSGRHQPESDLETRPEPSPRPVRAPSARTHPAPVVFGPAGTAVTADR